MPARPSGGRERRLDTCAKAASLENGVVGRDECAEPAADGWPLVLEAAVEEDKGCAR